MCPRQHVGFVPFAMGRYLENTGATPVRFPRNLQKQQLR
jgi:hypothetical protein